MASNFKLLEDEILEMIFDDEDDEQEEFFGFSRAEAEEMEREFEGDDSDFEDLLVNEDSGPNQVNLIEIEWSSDNMSEVEVPAFN